MSTPSVSIHVPIDHPHLPELLALAGAAPVDARPDAPPADEVLERLLQADLNPGEIAVLMELANNAPRVVAFERLRKLTGSGAKLGNVTSALYRRWRARGGTADNVPWPELDAGRHMTAESAQHVHSVLSPEC